MSTVPICSPTMKTFELRRVIAAIQDVQAFEENWMLARRQVCVDTYMLQFEVGHFSPAILCCAIFVLYLSYKCLYQLTFWCPTIGLLLSSKLAFSENKPVFVVMSTSYFRTIFGLSYNPRMWCMGFPRSCNLLLDITLLVLSWLLVWLWRCSPLFGLMYLKQF